MGVMGIEAGDTALQPRVRALRALHERVVAPLGFKFTPDEEIADFLLKQEVILEAKHGIPYCPCQPIRGERARDMRIVCPCIPFHRKHYDAMRRCWCGLFVHEDVTDPDSLPQLTEKELGLG
jgi:ferredoxin-thioredoxin reductase catalytic subunit